MTDAEIDAAIDKLSLSVAETISANKLYRAIFRAGMHEAAKIADLWLGDQTLLPADHLYPGCRTSAAAIRAAAGEREG